MEATLEDLRQFFDVVMPHLNEKQRRVVAGAMAAALGRGGKTAVAVASGLSRNTVIKAVRELEAGIPVDSRQREPGGGDLPAVEKQPKLLHALDELVEPRAPGPSIPLLRWTSQSTYDLAEELADLGFSASAELVRRLLLQMGYSLQLRPEHHEATSRSERDAQFRYLADRATAFVEDDQPVLSVSTSERASAGDQSGRDRHQRREDDSRSHVGVKDSFAAVGVPVHQNVLEIARDYGWSSVGEAADTVEFAVESIRRWWEQLGRRRHAGATRLLVTAHIESSDDHRAGAWKVHLAVLASETGLEITLCHHPRGTSRWNRVEHRLFSFGSMSWRGRPLRTVCTVVELIGASTSDSSLLVQAAYDADWQPTGTGVSRPEGLRITPHEWHGDWNYTVAAV